MPALANGWIRIPPATRGSLTYDLKRCCGGGRLCTVGISGAVGPLRYLDLTLDSEQCGALLYD